MRLSIVIPLLNEEESLQELHDWIVSVMQSNRFLYEIVFIDDGSTDRSWEVITALAAADPNVRGIRFLKNFGKSQALHAGSRAAQGDIVITMDADLQDNPEEIPEMVRKITEEGYQLVSGWKKKRYDHVLLKNLPSKLFNWAARKTSGVRLHDFNCGLKAFRSEVAKTIEVSGEMHRYIPVLVKNAGFGRIGEQVVRHQARKYGKTKFGAERFINGFLDLITIWFVSKFGKRPMHLFGALGVMAAAQGTMNNLSFGNARHQYYDTVCGGTGAGVQPDGRGFAGADAIQIHMTNSRLTDPEILEDRFPVRLERFAIRTGSGGAGRWPGGEGVVRRLRFLAPMTVAILSGSRRVPPFGLGGGGDGGVGRNRLERADGRVEDLAGCDQVSVQPGDLLEIATPGGGGYGPAR